MSAEEFDNLHYLTADGCTTNWGCRRSNESLDVYHAVGPDSSIVAVRGRSLSWNTQDVVQVGMSETEVFVVLGPPSERTEMKTESLTSRPGFHLENWLYQLPPVTLRLRFREGMLNSIFLYRLGALGPSRC